MEKIPVGNVTLIGDLLIPEGAIGIVLFAHGSGSSRLSPRNQFVAEQLRESNLATLLIDLLTPEEDQVDARFDIPRLSQRLIKITEWLKKNSETKKMKIFYFGASTGAAAALVAAAGRSDIAAIVSRGGRPDLAGQALAKVKAPTLLIVGGEDLVVIDLNKQAFELLSCQKELEIIPGAAHLFEEPGALEEVARMADKWFHRWKD